MAWHRTGDKPLPKPMMTELKDAYGTRGDELTLTESAMYILP